MRTSRAARAAAVVAVAAAAAAFGGAGAATAAPVAARIHTFENTTFVPGPGGGLVLNWGFAPAKVSVPSGATIAFTNPNPDPHGEPHTASVLAAADVPTTIDQIFNCVACGEILARHDPGNDGKPPFRTLVNSGRTGLDTPGDSRLLMPGTTVWAMVSAPAGTTLHYVCAIHPWMQAEIDVR